MTEAHTSTVDRPQHEYDDMAFAIMCMERGLPLKLRRAAGVTQQELGRRVGVSNPYILRWEKGQNRPLLTDLDRLASYGRELRRLARETGLVHV